MDKYVFLRKTVLLLASVCFIVFCSTACKTFEMMKGKTSDKKDVIALEIQYGEKMLDAVKKDNMKEFYSVLPEAVKKNFTENNYISARAQVAIGMGNIQSYQYLTQLNAPGYRSHVWKVVFKREKTLDSREDVVQEGLFRIVAFPTKDNTPYIVSFSFL